VKDVPSKNRQSASHASAISIGLMQVNPVVGAIESNTQLVIQLVQAHVVSNKPQVMVFPELVLTGYPPEDLVFRFDFIEQAQAGLNTIKAFSKTVPDVLIVVGAPVFKDGFGLVNGAFAFHNGHLVCSHGKHELPNYGVFDEKRYFQSVPVEYAKVFTFAGCCFSLSICEDVWHPPVVAHAASQGTQVILNLNASPYYQGKVEVRHQILVDRVVEARQLGADVSLVYVNQVGGQDELVFDGGSLVIDPTGVIAQLSSFQTQAAFVEYEPTTSTWLTRFLKPKPGYQYRSQQDQQLASIFQALVLGTHDYVIKNGFQKVLLGLSGGVDSALTLAIAVAALGAGAVQAVMMPFHYTAAISIEDAELQAMQLGVSFSIKPIAAMYEVIMASLSVDFAGLQLDATEENIQARCRGLLLMALSNKQGALVLTTGNKSELAVGYSTLYGDMAGGFDPIKDLPKTQVYALADFINRHGFELGFTVPQVIPQRVLDRPASAELRPDQTDQDSLPNYAILDGILYEFIEKDSSVNEIIQLGYDAETVHHVVNLVKKNEHKRRQAPPGVRLSARAFGRDRRYPITARWQ